MNEADLIRDAFGRISEEVHATLSDLPDAALTYRIDPGANTIAWLIWHLTRVQDDHIAGVANSEQVWTAQDWHDRFALPFEAREIGYGQSSDDVAKVRAGSDLLLGYHDAVHEKTRAFVETLSSADLDTVVDRNWNPPVTLGVRLVSVIADDLQHVGQAAFVAGVFARTAS